jgi:hypothetical protein
MYHREYPITPSQIAIQGALDIFVEGCRKNDMRQQLFGLSVLGSGSEAQVQAAKSSAVASQRVTSGEIEAMFAR